MEVKGYDEAAEVAVERLESNVREFVGSFEGIVALGGEEPAGGRIAEIERAWHRLRTDNDAASSDLVSGKIRGIDEDEVVEAKKASGPAGA